MAGEDGDSSLTALDAMSGHRRMRNILRIGVVWESFGRRRQGKSNILRIGKLGEYWRNQERLLKP